jgi:hypothetical protein
MQAGETSTPSYSNPVTLRAQNKLIPSADLFSSIKSHASSRLLVYGGNVTAHVTTGTTEAARAALFRQALETVSPGLSDSVSGNVAALKLSGTDDDR